MRVNVCVYVCVWLCVCVWYVCHYAMYPISTAETFLLRNLWDSKMDVNCVHSTYILLQEFSLSIFIANTLRRCVVCVALQFTFNIFWVGNVEWNFHVNIKNTRFTSKHAHTHTLHFLSLFRFLTKIYLRWSFFDRLQPEFIIFVEWILSTNREGEEQWGNRRVTPLKIIEYTSNAA